MKKENPIYQAAANSWLAGVLLSEFLLDRPGVRPMTEGEKKEVMYIYYMMDRCLELLMKKKLVLDKRR